MLGKWRLIHPHTLMLLSCRLHAKPLLVLEHELYTHLHCLKVSSFGGFVRAMLSLGILSGMNSIS